MRLISEVTDKYNYLVLVVVVSVVVVETAVGATSEASEENLAYHSETLK